jgi:DNA polymerase-3 subunit epsilon
VSGWLSDFKRWWLLHHLGDPRFRFMWDPPPADEWVALDCETTGLDRRRDEIVAIAAVRIRGNRVMCSERLELLVRPERRSVATGSVRVHQLRERDLAQGLAAEAAVQSLLHFIGSRPLVGYYLEFDIAMVNRVIRPWLGISLPNRAIEVSALYYDRVMRDRSTRDALYTGTVDLSFARILAELDLPALPAHDALNDALMTGLIYLKLAAPDG